MKNRLIVVTAFAVLFTILFYKNALGINLLVFELLIIISLLFSKDLPLNGKNNLSIFSGLLLTGVFSVLINSDFVIFVNILLFVIWLGFLIYPSARSMINAFGLSMINIPLSQLQFIEKLTKSKIGKQKSIGAILWKTRIFILPVLIIVVFFSIYNSANPLFESFMGGIGEKISNFFDLIFTYINFIAIGVFITGLLIANMIFFRYSQKDIIEHDLSANDHLTKNRRRGEQRSFKLIGLKQEYKAGVFLLSALNLLLLILNISDIQFVWFGFEWEGQYLKQFVHEGTYLLIVSILISIAIVLYYFRGSINFYQKNSTLKYLAYAWIFQNIILTISVAIRNFWYIHYFSLAYKRIGVILFLALCIYGLYTIIIKVYKQKSSSYLFRTNSYAFLILLTISSLFNWDGIITDYSFSHYEKSFVHLDYISELSNKCLPIMDKTEEELKEISKIQSKLFPFEEKYMTIDEYQEKIRIKKAVFIKEFEARGFWSWNLADYRAYKELCQ